MDDTETPFDRIKEKVSYGDLERVDKAGATSLRPLVRKAGRIYVAFNRFFAKEEWSGMRESDIHSVYNDNSPNRHVRLVTRLEPNGDGRQREVKYAGYSYEYFLKNIGGPEGEKRHATLIHNRLLFRELAKSPGFLGGKPDPGPQSSDAVENESWVSEDRTLVYQAVYQEVPYPDIPTMHYMMARL